MPATHNIQDSIYMKIEIDQRLSLRNMYILQNFLFVYMVYYTNTYSLSIYQMYSCITLKDIFGGWKSIETGILIEIECCQQILQPFMCRTYTANNLPTTLLEDTQNHIAGTKGFAPTSNTTTPYESAWHMWVWVLSSCNALLIAHPV